MKHTCEQSSPMVGSLLFDSFSTCTDCSNPSQVKVIIPTSIVKTIYNALTIEHQKNAQAQGIAPHGMPISYIEQTFRPYLLDQTKEFIVKFFVINCLYREIRRQKILVATVPQLIDIQFDKDDNLIAIFTIHVVKSLPLQEWKYLPFKAPQRKQYKDLDRQVQLFLEEEQRNIDEYIQNNGVGSEDWISTTITIVDSENKPLLSKPEPFWLKIGTEEADISFQELFLGKKIGDVLYTSNETLQSYFNEQAESNLNFCVTIQDIAPHAYVCPHQFKKHFRLKTNKELHQKMIEVFSYRNDMSQRKEMAEQAYSLLLSRNQFDAPQILVKQQKELILESLHDDPDYLVYKTHKDFRNHMQRLAEKQIKEILITDQLSYNEKIIVRPEDVHNYLNLTKRARTREFLYFKPPNSKIEGQEMPVPTEELHHTCLREKTLNHILYYLTKK